MTEMVIPHDIIAVSAQKLREFLISSDVFHHSVADLQDSLHFTLGFPLDCMNLCIAIL